MKACLLVPWYLGMLFAPFFTFGQNDYHPVAYTFNASGNIISSNVPLNEINTRAWRNFHRLFPGAGGEYWFAYNEGYEVSYNLNAVHYQAWLDPRGNYRYSLHYYPGKDIPREPGDLIRRKYPNYQLNIVTEVTDGDKTIYLVRLVSPTSIKTLSVCDGEINVIEEQAIEYPDPVAALTSRQFYP